ncbi:hypothetical protein [Ornithinimicrobium avium]|uniref:Uncharacterized protein n=1 Tax=Ornithinimicrobium avium TaxID=2283195 RepID=A0A345NNX3_9MICO|nr:hypothetical protein [Ornithinimicrobium avium]AXH96731.1 hypothetical protein DV701_11920 [Ornithinimicrobium avium]
MRNSVFLPLVAAAAVALGSGCAGPDGDSLAEQTQAGADVGADVTPEGDGANAEGDVSANDIADEELHGQLVESFPTDQVPLYAGDVVGSLGRMSDYLGLPEWNVDMTTADSFDDVDVAIRDAYSADGWEIASESKNPFGGNMLIARSGDYIATITYQEADNDGTSINYGVSQQ